MGRRFALVVLFLVLAACSGSPEPTPAAARAVITFRTSAGAVETGHLEVARTPAERERGLADRPWIPTDGGMVFLFDQTTRASFWMRGTLVPLSIAFWDEGGVVDILDMEPCRTEPCTLYTPASDYVAAAEMRKGWFAEHGVEVGDGVELELG